MARSVRKSSMIFAKRIVLFRGGGKFKRFCFCSKALLESRSQGSIRERGKIMKFKYSALLCFCALVGHGSSIAEPKNPMKPGMWSSLTEMSINGKQMPPKQSSRCFKQDEVDAMKIFEPSKILPIAEAVSCQAKDYVFDGKKAVWKTLCELKNSGSASVFFENFADASNVSTRSSLDAKMSGQSRSMIVKTTMERTGACP